MASLEPLWAVKIVRYVETLTYRSNKYIFHAIQQDRAVSEEVGRK